MMTRRHLLLSLLAAPFVPRVVAHRADITQITNRVVVKTLDGYTTVSYLTRDTFTRPGQTIEVRIEGVIHTKGVVESVTLHKEEGAMR